MTSGVTVSGRTRSAIGPSRSSVMRVFAVGAMALHLMLYFAPSTDEHVHEADEAHLRGAVVRLAEVAEDAGCRRGEDEAAVALLLHDAEGRLRDVEGALQVNVEDGVRAPSASSLANVLSRRMPALLITTSTVPKLSTAALTMPSPPSGVDTES